MTKPQVSEAHVLELAVMMMLCIKCGGEGDGVKDPEEGTLPCPNCKGSGVAPRFPELRRKCGVSLSNEFTNFCIGDDCGFCEGRRWLPLPVPEAAGALRKIPEFQQWIAKQYGSPTCINEVAEAVIYILCDDYAVIAAATKWAGIEASP